MVAKQSCLPANIFDPVGDERFLFLGCSISTFSASVGWGEQASELTVSIAQDECPEQPRSYFDRFLNKKVLDENTPDPGFTNPTVGSPAYFRLGDFEFCGIIQSYEKTNNSNINPGYTVVLTSPTEILANVQIIVSDYAGSVRTTSGAGLFNIINAFGYMEQFGVLCPETTINGATFGTPAGGFGGANSNNRGTQYNRLITAVSLLTSSLPKLVNNFSPFGRIMFKGAVPSTDGYGSMAYDVYDIATPISFINHSGYLAEYFVDLSELPIAPEEWRIAGPTVSLMELISQACDDGGCDFYIELVPVKLGTNTVIKILKIRTAARFAQPNLNQIAGFLSSADGVINQTVGRELRNEETTSFLVGGKKQTLFQVDQDTGGAGEADDIITPFFGFDTSGNAILATHDGEQWSVDLSLIPLNIQLFTPLDANSVEITEDEFRVAIAGKTEWLSYTLGKPTALGTLIKDLHANLKGSFDPAHILKILDDLLAKKLLPKDFVNVIGRGLLKTDDTEKDIDVIYNWVLKFAREYYGKQFMVRLPYTCAKTDSETGEIVTSEIPSDGGWTEVSTIIGLAHPSASSDFFSLDDGRVGCFVRYDNAENYEFSHLDVDDYIAFDTSGIGTLYVKGSLRDEFVYLDKANLVSPRVVVELPESVLEKENTDGIFKPLKGLELLLRALAANPAEADTFTTKIKSIGEAAGNLVMNMGAEHKSVMFDAASVPLESNVSTYGPWFVRGPAGAVRAEIDSSLVPWEFGSVAAMSAAGLAKVQESITLMQEGESGSVTVAGYPSIPLGAEIGSVTNGFFNVGQHILENRSLVNNDFSENGPSGSVDIVWGSILLGQWTGLYGPNVTDISVSVEDTGITTRYTMRTFTPKFGRFTKQNSERLKQAGQLQTQRVKQFRQAQRDRANLRSAIKRFDSRGKLLENGDELAAHSPVDVFVSQAREWLSTKSRTYTALHKYRELASEMAGEFDEKAMMSLDGLLRPFTASDDDSVSGVEGYSNFVDGSTFIVRPDPPVDAYTGVNKGATKLNPFSTSSPYGTSVAHDIDIVGRDSPPASSMQRSINSQGGGSEESNPKVLALRGPLVMKGWGYTLDGKPVPNADESGLTQDEFLEDFLQRQDKWKIGPIDLRWNQSAGKWVPPQPFRDIDVYIDSTISPFTSGTASIFQTDSFTGSDNELANQTLYDGEGNAITGSSGDITLSEFVGNYIPSGVKVVARYDELSNTYFPVHSASYGGFVAKTTSAITAATDAGGVRTVGSGTIDIYMKNDSHELEQVSGMTGLNIFNSTVQTEDTGKWVQSKLDPWGSFWLDVADCATSG